MKKKKYSHLTTTRIIMAGFIIGIIFGIFLLSLPVAQKSQADLIDIVFMATSSVCVTGLSTLNVGTTFTMFGQIVLLILIEAGGLGIITFTVFVMILIGKKIDLSNRLLIQNAYNTDSLAGLIKMTKRIVVVSFVIQLIGAFFYSFAFVSDYGAIGIWYGIFHSVSAYCNAGIDVLGGNSFVQYRNNPIVNLTTIALVVTGGIGFPVFWEIARLIRAKSENERYKKKINLRTRIVLLATLVLILLGMLITLIFEWNNPLTLGNLPLGEKLWAALFQSVTLRTAGFATIDQSGFTEASCLVYLPLMLIGGSPAGTAGGIKTVTVVVLFLTMISSIKGSNHVNVFHRQIDDSYIKNCCAIASFSILTLIVLTSVLMYVQDANFLDTVYEMTSAVATVGLSRGLTGELTGIGKIIVCLTMYLGRIGPITIALSFNYGKKSELTYANDKLIIG